MTPSEIIACLGEMIQQTSGVSDVHIHGGSAVYLRADGQIRPAGLTVTDEDIIELITHYAGGGCAERLQTTGDADFALSAGGARFRANGFMRQGGVCLILRVIAEDIPDSDRLGLPEIARQMMHSPDGLVLVTGATGSGKSTSLAAMIDYVNTRLAKIIYTIEDPIEFLHHNKSSVISQREVGIHTSSFAVGLKAVLRQDPDIILLGELRDFETISLALTAAETGHLVLATLHTRTASDAVSRIIDVYPERQQAQAREQLASSLQMVMTQQLVPAISGGRVASFEVLVNTPAVAHHIREAKTAQLISVMQTSADAGMITMQASLSQLEDAGLIKGPLCTPPQC